MAVDGSVHRRTRGGVVKDGGVNICGEGCDQGISSSHQQRRMWPLGADESSKAEACYYDTKYAKSVSRRLTFLDFYEEWHDRTIPENLILLKSMDNLHGKTVLLLGNGISYKELYFLVMGAKLILTDVSYEAVKFMKSLFSFSELKEMGYVSVQFNTADALDLPFSDDSIDLVYGYAFVHHIRDLSKMLSEIYRVLKKGGECRFLDDAYSPIWHYLKTTILRPLQRYSHERYGLSPEDLRFTKEGGFRIGELRKELAKHDFQNISFVRFGFFSYIWKRGLTKLFGVKSFRHATLLRMGLSVLCGVDMFLAKRSKVFRDNQIRLVCAITK